MYEVVNCLIMSFNLVFRSYFLGLVPGLKYKLSFGSNAGQTSVFNSTSSLYTIFIRRVDSVLPRTRSYSEIRQRSQTSMARPFTH